MSRVYWLSLQQKILLGRDGYFEGGGVSPIPSLPTRSSEEGEPRGAERQINLQVAGAQPEGVHRIQMHTPRHTDTDRHPAKPETPPPMPLPPHIPPSKQFRPKGKAVCSEAASPTERGSSSGEKRRKARGEAPLTPTRAPPTPAPSPRGSPSLDPPGSRRGRRPALTSGPAAARG